MSKKYVIGVDIGTTSTKAVLFQLDGTVVAGHHIEYPLFSPTPDTAEQDSNEIFQAVIQSIGAAVQKSAVSSESILCVSFSSAMHSLLAVNEKGEPLSRCMTWADNRSAPYAEKIIKEMNGHKIYEQTGTPIHPMSPLSKLVWLRHEHPSLFTAAHKFISIKEFIFYKLFHQYVIDYSIATATGMCNLKQLNWDEEALNVAGISKERLSEIVPTTSIFVGLPVDFAYKMNVQQTTPFVIGASDGILSNLGINAMDPGTVAMTIGTSGAIRTMLNQPKTDPNGRTFCYALTEHHWIVGGAVNNGGIVFRWLRDNLCLLEKDSVQLKGIDAYDLLTNWAAKAPAGSSGLLFHPYLTGERAPLWDPNARGSFFGLTLHHKKEHMIRAVLEGVVFNLYSVMVALEEFINHPVSIQATGGFARSAFWRQLVADIFNLDVFVPESFESSCLGAAVLGLYSVGEIKELRVSPRMIGALYHHKPIPQNVEIYSELTSIFLHLSRKLKEEYQQIATFQKKWVR